MEEIKNKALQTLTDLAERLGVDPMILAGGFGALLLILIILLIRRKPKATFPGLVVNLFQIAPLGRDAFLKIKNPAESIVLSQYKIIGRNDILVKNHLSGHRLETQKEYSILLEVEGNKRLDNNFSMELTYIDDTGKVYKQKLLPGEQRAEKPKRMRKTV